MIRQTTGRLLIAALALSGCGRPGPDDTAQLAKAQALFAQRQYRESAIELKNALQQNPANAQARLLLGRFYLESGLYPAAEIELRRAGQSGLPDAVVQPYLAEAFLHQEQFGEVVKLAEGLLDRERFADVLKMEVQEPLPAPAKAHLLASQALAHLGLDQRSEAHWAIEEALKVVPDSAYALTVKGRLAAVADDLAEATRLSEAAIAADRAYGPAWSLLGDIALRNGDPAAAEAAFTTAIGHQLNNARDLVKRCLLRVDQHDYDGAQADIDQLEKRFPRHEDIDFLKGRLAFAKQDLPGARDALARSIEHRTEHGPTLFYLGTTQFLLGSDASASGYLLSYLSQQPGSAATRKMLAVIDIRARQYAAAERRIRPVVDSDGDDTGALTILATALLRAGKTEDALAAMQRVVDLGPQSTDAQIRLGTGQYIAGQFANAAETLEQAIALDAANEKPYMLLTRLYLDAKNPDKAWEVANRLQQQSPGSATAHNMLGSALAAQGRSEAARESFERAASLRPGDPFSNHELAQIALRANDPQRARAYYQAVLGQQREHLPTLLRLARLEGALGNRQAQLEALRQAARAYPAVLEPQLALAQHYLDAGDAQMAQVTMSSARERFENDPRWLLLFGRIQLRLDDPRGALISLSRVKGSGREAATILHLRALAQAALGRPEEAAIELEGALAADPSYLPARLTQVQLLFNQKKLAEADAELTRIKNGVEPTAEILMLEGRLATARGQQSKAETAFRGALARKPDTASVLALTQLLWDTGKGDEATAILKDWATRHPEDLRGLIGLANAYRGSNRMQEAIRIYEQVLKTDSRNTEALNNLAWALRQSAPNEALAYARRAYALDRDSAQVMDTLAVVAWAAGEGELAERTFARALEATPEDLGLRFHHAQFLEQRGKRDQALAELRQLLADPRPFSERTEAQTMLARLSAP